MSFELDHERELKKLRREKSGLRQGEVTAVSPLEVSIGGGSAVLAQALDGVELEVGDRVSVEVQGSDFIVLGRNTDDPQDVAGTPSGSAGGDLAGTYPNPQIATGAITNADISDTAGIGGYKINLNSLNANRIVDGTITNAKVSASAAIDQSKIDGLEDDLAGKASTSHAASHKDGGTDELKLHELGEPSADWSNGGCKITNGNDPTSALDFATKQYVDTGDFAAAAGYKRKTDVSAAPTGWATVSPFESSDTLPPFTHSGGVLTGTLNSELWLDLDNDQEWTNSGLALPTVGESFLVLTEVGSNAKYNGIYTLIQQGDNVSQPWKLARRSDADTNGELVQFNLVRSEASGRQFYLASDTPTIDVSDQDWREYDFADSWLRSRQAASASVLPGSPFDDQEIYFDTGQGLWHFRYDAADDYWYFVGGPPMVIEDNDARTLTNQTTYTNLPTDPMSITLPALAGDFDIEVQATITPLAAGAGNISYSVGGTSANDNWASAASLATGQNASVAKRTRHTGLSASASIAEKARTAGNYSVIFATRRILIWPVRVSS